MTKIEDIEKAISELSEDDLAKFRAWYEEFDSRRFDEKIEQDVISGALDKHAEAAIADYQAGKAKQL